MATLTVDDICAVARDGASAGLAAAATRRIEASHAALLATIGAGDPVYGVTTGLGAAVDTRLGAANPAHQRRIPLARAAGVGPRLERETVRAIMLARLSRLACGASRHLARDGGSPARDDRAWRHPVGPLDRLDR